ncbi:MAG: hypothetical protein WAM09_15135 [Anaerolineales bacterium]|jgi:hypothetical protein
MMKLLSSRLLWGLVLVVGGVLLLLDTFGIFKGGALFWTIVSGVAGVLFLSLYISNHDNWWALIPGIIFLAVAATIGLDSFLPGFSDTNLGGTIILGGIALSFLLVYLAERGNWWAIIPAGVMTTIALVAVLDTNTSSLASGGIFFLGLGITFALVAILPTSVGKMRWAWIPAGILGLMGVLILIAAEDLINYIWPLALILAGIVLVARSINRK